jgi:hypothetical protein
MVRLWGIRGADYTFHMGKMYTKFWWENMKERNYFKHLYINGRILLK